MKQETEDWLRDTAQVSYKERLRAALKARHMSQAAFARYCGCSPSNVSGTLRNGHWPVPKYMWQVAKRLLGM